MNREHYRADGRAKIRMYQWEAEDEALLMSTYGEPMTAYRCSVCHDWHIGRESRWVEGYWYGSEWHEGHWSDEVDY